MPAKKEKILSFCYRVSISENKMNVELLIIHEQ